MKSYIEAVCACGKRHEAKIDDILIGKGVIARLPEVLARYDTKKVFVLADVNTYAAAGEQVCAVLDEAGLPYSSYIFPQQHLEPDEHAVGSAVMHFDKSCNAIVTVGSGVLNDIGKILSSISDKPYIVVGTAPSMDGYASGTSSMTMEGLKISLNSRCADVIIGDVDILKNAPLHMLKSGIGDMLAKYVSLAEWRIAHLLLDEYYCDEVAALVRVALKKCVDNAEGLLQRDETAVEAVFEGLVIGGLAMAYAGLSRPASGVEHYFSHLWDMRGVEFGTPIDLHGIQCAWGTLAAAKLYDRLKTMTPDHEKAAAYVAAFDLDNWNEQLKAFLGNGALPMIAQEEKEQKYNKATHAARFAKIEQHWDDILTILNEELPSAAQIEGILDTLEMDKTPRSISVDRACMQMTFKAAKDIRDKYILSRLAWDLGLLDELSEGLEV